MCLDQLDERNAMVKSILAFEEVGQVSLADLGSRLSRLWLVQHPENHFLRPSTKCDDPSIFSGRLDDRNMMVMSIMHSRQFWVSTYALLLFSKACVLKSTFKAKTVPLLLFSAENSVVFSICCLELI